MPISLDFPEITDAFRKFLLLPVRLIAHHFEAIAVWLEKRVKTADLLERASRDIPIVDFEGDAVVAWIDALQARGLAPDEMDPGLGEHLADAGQRFIKGAWGNLKNLVAQELILPKFFISLADAVRAIEESVDRFTKNPQQMTDLLFGHSGVATGDSDRRRAGDLWGEAALAYRVVASSLDQFKAFQQSRQRAREILSASSPTDGARSGAGPSANVFTISSAAAARPAALEDSLENYGRYLVAGLLLLPALPAFAVSFWRAVSIRVRALTLEKLAGYERSLNELRQKVIDFFFTGLYLMIHKAVSYVFSAQRVLSANIRFFGEAAMAYGEAISDSVRTWLKDIGDLLNKYIGYVNLILDALRAIFDFDVGKVIAEAMLGSAGPIAEPAVALMPKITLGDLIGATSDALRGASRVALTALAKAVKLYVSINPLISDSFISERLSRLDEITNYALKKYPSLGKGPAFKLPDSVAFPDLYQTFFASGLADFRRSVDQFGETTAKSLRDIPGAVSVALKITGDELENAAEQANNTMVSRSLGQLAAAAADQSNAAFGKDIEELSAKIAASQRDPVADKFEAWLAGAGFAMLTEAIPAYFATARQFWEQRERRGEEAAVRIDKTSPHILAKRAMLARAVVKKICVNAIGKTVDKSLAKNIAERFRAAVQQAHIDGGLRLELYGIEEA